MSQRIPPGPEGKTRVARGDREGRSSAAGRGGTARRRGPGGPSARSGPARQKAARRRRTAEESHAALIAAAQSLMAAGEPLTTVNLTAAAGLAQPTFYAYFPSVERCRLAAIESAVARLAALDAEWQAQLVWSAGDLEGQVEIMTRWLEGARQRGDIRSIYDRHRDEDSRVGELLRAMAEAHIARLSEGLWRAAVQRGVGPDSYGEIRLLALTLSASVAAVARAVHQGEVTDLRAAARLLVRNGAACLSAMIAACARPSDP